MKKIYGYAGNILYVDLTSGEIRKEPLDLDKAKDFIGGMGLSSELAYDLINPGIDPFSAHNVLIFGAGPLVGTLAPGSSRTDPVGKSPLITQKSTLPSEAVDFIAQIETYGARNQLGSFEITPCASFSLSKYFLILSLCS